jgi:hypothetical protein
MEVVRDIVSLQLVTTSSTSCAAELLVPKEYRAEAYAIVTDDGLQICYDPVRER